MSKKDNKLHDEFQYINLVNKIIHEGLDEKGRNGYTKSIFGYSMRFSLQDGVLPILTTKHVGWKTCLKELQWFLSGSTDVSRLQESNVHIWDGNASREFLDERGLKHLREGDLGPIYGHQWRHYNAPYSGCDTIYDDCGVDQIAQLINALRDTSQHTSRRMILTAWNPCQLSEMALPPCHILAQFKVKEGKRLSCALYQRSGDVGLGVPYNITSYSLLTHILAYHCGLEADEFIYFIGDAHIYKEHEDALKIQIIREPYEFPSIRIIQKHEKIEDYNSLDIDFITDYISHKTIQMKIIS